MYVGRVCASAGNLEHGRAGRGGRGRDEREREGREGDGGPAEAGQQAAGGWRADPVRCVEGAERRPCPLPSAKEKERGGRYWRYRPAGAARACPPAPLGSTARRAGDPLLQFQWGGEGVCSPQLAAGGAGTEMGVGHCACVYKILQCRELVRIQYVRTGVHLFVLSLPEGRDN